MKKYTLTLVVTLMAFSAGMTQLPSSLGSVGGADIGSLVSQFSNDGLSSDAMDSDFDLAGFADKAKGVTKIARIGKLVNKLIGHIKPGMFKEGVDTGNLLDMGKSVKSIADSAGLMKKLNDSLLPKAFNSGWGQKSGMWSKALDALM